MTSAAPKSDSPRALKCDLAAEVLGSSGTLRLRAAGRSMLPVVWPGDTLLIVPTAAGAVAEGDVVLFRRAHQFFAHRVMRAENAGDSTILTRGDALPYPDPPVTAKDLLGKVSFIVRDGRLIEVGRNLSFPQRTVARVMRRSRIAARLVTGVHGMLRGSRHQNPLDRAVPCQS